MVPLARFNYLHDGACGFNLLTLVVVIKSKLDSHQDGSGRFIEEPVIH